MGWSNKELSIYSDRTDLDEGSFEFLCKLTLARRKKLSEIAQGLWDEDQTVIRWFMLDKMKRSKSQKASAEYHSLAVASYHRGDLLSAVHWQQLSAWFHCELNQHG